MYIFQQLVIVILLIQVINSEQKDIRLHYPTRQYRSDEDDDRRCNVVGYLAQIVSLVIFVFYLLIILGLIKACLGLCCNTIVGELGLDLILEHPEYNKNTIFCMNLIFFLILPFALLRKIRWRPVSACPGPKSCPSKPRRMWAGQSDAIPEPKPKLDTKTEPKFTKPSHTKKKKGNLDVYRDGNESEAQDTKYVLEQLHRSEQSLKNEIFSYTME